MTVVNSSHSARKALLTVVNSGYLHERHCLCQNKLQGKDRYPERQSYSPDLQLFSLMAMPSLFGGESGLEYSGKDDEIWNKQQPRHVLHICIKDLSCVRY